MLNKLTFTAIRRLYCHNQSKKIDKILGAQIGLHFNGLIHDVYIQISKQIDREISDLINALDNQQ